MQTLIRNSVCIKGKGAGWEKFCQKSFGSVIRTNCDPIAGKDVGDQI